MDVDDFQQKTFISLLIKTPSQAVGDQIIDGVRLNWTVKDLKSHISNVYPTKPTVNDQRLIYAGKLLPDHLQLKDVFRQNDRVPSLHLVCTYRPQPQGTLGNEPQDADAQQPGPSGSTTSSTATATDLRQRRRLPPSSSSSSSVQTQWTTTWPQTAASGPGPVPGPGPVSPPSFPTFSLYSPQQILWLQHVYARQYYFQYQAALAAAGSASSSPPSLVGPHPPVPAHQVPVPAPLPNQNQNPVQNMNPADQNQNLMNAQGGAVMEDEDGAERDWLDWMYSAARLGVLLMIVYFNSNLSRFLLVMGTLLLMYLHTAGLFPFRRPQVQPPVRPQPPAAQQNPDPVERDDEPAADGAEELTAVLVPPHRVSVMWTAWVFFKTFFSSLIPEARQGVAN